MTWADSIPIEAEIYVQFFQSATGDLLTLCQSECPPLSIARKAQASRTDHQSSPMLDLVFTPKV